MWQGNVFDIIPKKLTLLPCLSFSLKGYLVKKFILTLLLLSSVAQSWAISDEAAYGLTAITGCATGLLGAGLSDGKTVVGVICGLVGAGLGHFFWHQFTPTGRMKRAMSRIGILEQHPLVVGDFDQDQIIMDVLQETYVSSEWPLMTAFSNLNYLNQEAITAYGLLVAAREEDPSFTAKAVELEKTVNRMVKNIVRALKALKTNKDYAAQLEQFKREQQHKEEMAAKWAKVHAAERQADAAQAQACAQLQQANQPRVVIHHIV